MLIRAFILEEQSLTRAGVRSYLENARGVEVVGESADPAAGLKAMMAARPDVVIVGATFHGKRSDQILNRLLSLVPKPGILVMAEQEDAPAAEQAFKAGALGYLSNSADAETLLNAVRLVAQHKVAISPRMSEELLRRMSRSTRVAPKDPTERLSARELEVFLLTGKGLEAKQIASDLEISSRTVDVHRANIRAKLGIYGAHELMRYAMQWQQNRRFGERLQGFCDDRRPLLLVEDDEVDILSVERGLQELGAETRLVVARTAEEALRYLRAPTSVRPGLVLLDLKMPGMNGQEFLEEIRRDAALSSLPVVVLTASQLEDDKRGTYSKGIAGYLVKPANSAEFVEMLGTLAQYWSINEPPPAAPAGNGGSASNPGSAGNGGSPGKPGSGGNGGSVSKPAPASKAAPAGKPAPASKTSTHA